MSDGRWPRASIVKMLQVFNLSRQFLAAPCEGLFSQLLFSDVAGETLCVDEAVSVPLRAGIDGDVSNRAVLVFQPRLVIAELFTAPEPRENVRDHVLVRVEFRNRTADVLFSRVAKQLQFSFVGPENRAVRPRLMNAFHGRFQKITQLLFAAGKGFLGHFAFGYLRFQNSRFLL